MKKITALFLTIIMLVGVIAVAPMSANAEETTDFENAITLPVDGTVAQGEFENADDVEYFKFSLETAGMIYFQIKSDQSEKGQRISGTVYREDMTTVEFTISQYVNEYYEFWNSCEVIDSGTYILALTSDASYTFTVACDIDAYGDVADAAKEPNNNFTEAKSVAENQVVSGVLSINDKVDIYKFTLASKQKVTIYRDAYLYTDPAFTYMWPLELNIYNDYHKSVQSKRLKYYSDGKDKAGKEWSYVYEYVLYPGTYYMTLNYEDTYYRDIYVFKYELSEPEPMITKKDGTLTNFTRLEAGEEIKLAVANGEVVKWKTNSSKTVKVTKKGKVTALAQGEAKIIAILKNGEKIEDTFYVINNPGFQEENGERDTAYFTVKKGKTKKIYISGKAYNIDNVFKGNSYVKVKGNVETGLFEIKGLKKGLSVIKVKVNRNWYRLTVNVK